MIGLAIFYDRIALDKLTLRLLDSCWLFIKIGYCFINQNRKNIYLINFVIVKERTRTAIPQPTSVQHQRTIISVRQVLLRPAHTSRGQQPGVRARAVDA